MLRAALSYLLREGTLLLNRDDFTRRFAESLRGLNEKMDNIERLVGWNMNEHLTESGDLERLLCELLDVPPWDRDIDLVRGYLCGETDYVVLLSQVKRAQDEFIPEEYADFLDVQERLFGGGIR